MQFAPAAIPNDHGANVPATLHHSHNDSLVFSACAGDDSGALAPVHVAGLASDEGFIYLNLTTGAAQVSRILALQCVANPLQHEPRDFWVTPSER